MNDDEIDEACDAIERELEGLGEFPPGEWVTVNGQPVYRESTAFTALITDENGEYKFTTPLGAALEISRRAANAPRPPLNVSPAPDGPPAMDAPWWPREWLPPGATS
ncbi:hypothetical protein [Actinacidiphila rubida]|uniref:Uncharacterized protein n=1 Tax=Actinacidiphila rubida TaxID=310780 RepID=A0A1H8L9I1_9ACTN|nr:hypothetical protein [Actinacidiphila rubida]SEO01466.1 hypothetical protein SAMN05216267_101598 [Actinacidiphila rubida]